MCGCRLGAFQAFTGYIQHSTIQQSIQPDSASCQPLKASEPPRHPHWTTKKSPLLPLPAPKVPPLAAIPPRFFTHLLPLAAPARCSLAAKPFQLQTKETFCGCAANSNTPLLDPFSQRLHTHFPLASFRSLFLALSLCFSRPAFYCIDVTVRTQNPTSRPSCGPRSTPRRHFEIREWSPVEPNHFFPSTLIQTRDENERRGLEKTIKREKQSHSIAGAAMVALRSLATALASAALFFHTSLGKPSTNMQGREAWPN